MVGCSTGRTHRVTVRVARLSPALLARGRMPLRGKKAAAKPEAVKAEKSATPRSSTSPASTQAAVQAEKSATPRSSTRTHSHTAGDRGGDERRRGDSRGGGGRPDGGDDGAADSRFEFVVTVLQCDGLQKAGRLGQADVFVSLGAGSASGQSAPVPYDGGRPQWNRGRGYVPTADTFSSRFSSQCG